MENQTAVEWLCNQIYTIQVELKAGNQSLKDKIDKAKEMEKQQIIDAFEQGEYTGRGFEDLTSEEYYHINFKP